MDRLEHLITRFAWADLSHQEAWESWRAAKIRMAESMRHSAPVALDSLTSPVPEALAEIERRCRLENFALYEAAGRAPSVESASAAILSFARRLGFTVAEDHRSAGPSSVVALRTSSEQGKMGYIPYTPRPMSWHTDGYYNPPERPVKGFILHCFQQAAAGGENQLLDPEIAYLRLREADPAYVRALMHPEAMTIPENREPDGTLRPASVGPVFFPDRATGRLQMRYTARTRSIAWRDDATTRAAAEWLRAWLAAGDPLMRRVRLAPGQGIVSNNVLHTRTAFEDGADDRARIILRIRFHERVTEERLGAA